MIQSTLRSPNELLPRDTQQPTNMFVAYFEAAFEEELKERTITQNFRESINKISSPYGFIRNEGLHEALQCLCKLSVEAAEEAAAIDAGRGGGSSGGPHLPYDAVRTAVMPRAVNDAQPEPRGRSESWERTQRALQTADYTTAVFRLILVPHMDVRTRYNAGGPVNVELSEDDALAWNTLRHGHASPAPRPSTNISQSATADAAAAGTSTLAPPPHPPMPSPQQRQKGGDDLGIASRSATPRKPLDVSLTEVTYQEQELALRLLQGLSLMVYHQRRQVVEGLLIPYTIGVWQCCLQHMDALFRRRRRECAALPTALPAPHDEAPVELEAGLVGVLVASIDAVEAACHYNPQAIARLVQQGGVRALLNLVLCPYAPHDIRCAVLDTVSVLMQEVAPFRRAVAGGAAAAAGGDELVQTMIQEAMTGQFGRHSVPPPYLMDRASASKFDSAVRDWFSQRGLSHIVTAVLELRDVRGTPIAPGAMSKAEVTRVVERSSQLREKRLQALLQAVDGKRAAL